MLKHFDKLKSRVLFKKKTPKTRSLTQHGVLFKSGVAFISKSYFEFRIWILKLPRFLLTGPNLTHGISHHAMVKVNDDLIVIGGKSVEKGPSTITSISPYLNRLTFLNGKLQWILLPQKLKIPRHRMVAAVIPDDFLDCS